MYTQHANYQRTYFRNNIYCIIFTYLYLFKNQVMGEGEERDIFRRLKPGAQRSIWDSYVDGRGPTTGAIPCCLPGYKLAATGIVKEVAVTPNQILLIGNADNSSGVLTVAPNICLICKIFNGELLKHFCSEMDWILY